jgi:hypothetical protein
MENIIIYGKENSLKYKHAIDIIKPLSKTQLNYKRKIEISLNDNKYYFNISDVHFEVDFDLFGTNEYSLWLALYQQIQICKELMGKCIVLCMNFHCIKDELLDIFYIFLRDPTIRFILCTRNMSSLPESIKHNCRIICLKEKSNRTLSIKLCDPIIEMIYSKKVDYFLLRELLYNLLTYNLNIHECFYYILNSLINREYITTNDIELHIKDIVDIIKKYNNNYRTIYHLERFVMYLIILKE